MPEINVKQEFVFYEKGYIRTVYKKGKHTVSDECAAYAKRAELITATRSKSKDSET